MPVSHHSVFTSRMPFLPPNQQCQSTEGTEVPLLRIKLITNTWNAVVYARVAVRHLVVAFVVLHVQGHVALGTLEADLVPRLHITHQTIHYNPVTHSSSSLRRLPRNSCTQKKSITVNSFKGKLQKLKATRISFALDTDCPTNSRAKPVSLGRSIR